MRPVIRLPVFAVLVGAGILAAGHQAQAQYVPGYGSLYGGFAPFNPRGYQVIPRNFFGALPPLQPLAPLPGVNGFNPLMFNPFYRGYNPATQSAALYYGLNRLYSPSQPSYTPYPSVYSSPSLYPATYSRMMATQKGDSPYYSYEKAQQKEEKVDEKSPAAGRGTRPGPTPKQKEEARLARALAAKDPAVLATGDPLNEVFLAIVEKRHKSDTPARVESSHLSPSLLSEIHFAGGANATAMNLLGPGRKWEPPAAFTEGPLGEIGDDLTRDFNAAVGRPLAGLPPDQVKVADLEKAVRQAKTYLDMVIDDLSFDDAVAAREFVNQLEAVVVVLKSPSSTGLIDPRWSTEGTTVADLVDHMDRYKYRFGRALKGNADAYVALHRGLSAYLFALDGATRAKK